MPPYFTAKPFRLGELVPEEPSAVCQLWRADRDLSARIWWRWKCPPGRRRTCRTSPVPTPKIIFYFSHLTLETCPAQQYSSSCTERIAHLNFNVKLLAFLAIPHIPLNQPNTMHSLVRIPHILPSHLRANPLHPNPHRNRPRSASTPTNLLLSPCDPRVLPHMYSTYLSSCPLRVRCWQHDPEFEMDNKPRR